MENCAARLGRAALFFFESALTAKPAKRNPVSMTRYETLAAQLRAMGLTIRSLPGEYCLNFRSGGERTARFAEDLDHALEIGREMAADAKANGTATKRPPRRQRWRKQTTPKARRRRFIRAHNRRVRARALRRRRTADPR